MWVHHCSKKSTYLHLKENDIVSHHMYIIMGYIISFFFLVLGHGKERLNN